MMGSGQTGTMLPMRRKSRSNLEGDISRVVSASDKFTVLVQNEMLGTSRFVGSFDAEDDAVDYADAERARSRSFVAYELWTGAPKYPGHFVRALGRGALTFAAVSGAR